VEDLSDRSRRFFELAERVVERLDANPGEYSVREIESLIEKICNTTKTIPSEKPGKTKPNPEFNLLRLLVRELAREKRMRWGPTYGGHKLRPD